MSDWSLAWPECCSIMSATAPRWWIKERRGSHERAPDDNCARRYDSAGRPDCPVYLSRARVPLDQWRDLSLLHAYRTGVLLALSLLAVLRGWQPGYGAHPASVDG